MKSKFAIGLIALSLSIAGCAESAPAADAEKTSQAWGRVEAGPVNYTVETVTDGLDHPWSLAFLPDGTMLMSERSGKLKHVGADGAATLVLDFNTLEDTPVHTKNRSQAGLFDILLHPDFADNNFVYISYAGKIDGKSTLVLNRYVWNADKTLSDSTRIFTASPTRKQSNHYGGRMIFNTDGTLMITYGEAFHHREKAQTLDNHFGKIIRVNDDGSIPGDNPFASGKDADGNSALPEIWSYGHRNPQGIILAADGRVLSNEHGPMGGDEVNHIQKGKNYGWPVATYGLDYSGARVSPFQAVAGTEQSLVHFVPSIAPSGFAQYSGDGFPDWQGDLFISALALKHVRHIDMNADGSLGDQRELFKELDARIRDVRSGPDGYLYLLTEDKTSDGGKILRVKPK